MLVYSMLCPTAPPSAVAACMRTMTGSRRKQGLLKAALLFLVLALSLRGSVGISDPVEVLALGAIKRGIGDVFGKLDNWVGDDPCGSNWAGILCTPTNGTQYVTELRLLNMNFTGTLAPDLGNLTKLVIMDFMWNNITGSIPLEVGYLSNLYLLLLSGNKLSGTLPSELGNLSKLNRMQIDENNISGPVPPSFQYLNQAKHFHMNNNSLNGSIPPELGRLQTLAHFMLDNNDLSGELPSELSNISTLVILQLDNNQFNGSIPSSYSNMSTLTKLSLRNCSLTDTIPDLSPMSALTYLSLRNCNLTGTIPDLSPMSALTYLDLSHNQLTGQLPSNVSQTLRTIDLSYNQLNGEVPSNLYGLQNLEFLLLQNNSLDGSITANLLTHNSFTSPDSVLVLDFKDNNITGFTSGALLAVPNVTLRLYGNPVCSDPSTPSNLCLDYNGTDANITFPITAAVPLPPGCSVDTCDISHNEELVYGLLASGFCHCAYPLIVGYRLKSPGFAIFPPYENAFYAYMSSALNVSRYQVNVSEYSWDAGPRLSMNIKLFPTNTTSQFTDSEVAHLYDTFATWNLPGNKTFGPNEMLFFTIGYPYNISALTTPVSESGLKGGVIAGIVIGVAAFTAIIAAAVVFLISKHLHRYALPFRAGRRRHERIKVSGVKDFTYEEMARATKNFEGSMQIGQGGYGKVYRAVLADGMEVAIKRAEEGSFQGGKEFYTEIELLSRVHHRNLVSLIGYCDDKGEQMLVYEFMVNGTLRDHLNSGSKTPLDFPTRLQIALGSAKGILYLHTEANPPIFHRDIKASNILLDGKRRAKVADFGLSKLAPVAEIEGAAGGYVSTVVKGTPGYLDPEYFLTHKLTDKSDVYSFGVVLLELITGMQPISQGKNLVREVNLAYEAGMMLSIVDPRMGAYPSECLQLFLRLAIACCEDDTDSRPSMAEVVRELEAILHITPLADSMASFETSVDTEACKLKHPQKGLGSNNPYVSSDIDGSGLISGVIPYVGPR